MSASILFSNFDKTIFVLDIPGSIASAQGGGRIWSTQPLEKPYRTPEPNGEKRAALISRLSDENIIYHDAVQLGIKKALQDAAAASGIKVWCSAREIVGGNHALSLGPAHETSSIHIELPVVFSSMQNDFLSFADVQHRLLINPDAKPTYVTFDDTTCIFVPARSTLIWSSMKYCLDIMQDFSKHSSCNDLGFDLILMDPPWPNRSVRHARQYATCDQQAEGVFEQALQIVDKFHRSRGYVGIWITNKAAIRAQALTSLSGRGFKFVEEWIWIKITYKGEPVTSLDGIWRKPYEIMLLFRDDIATSAHPVKRRYIIAVPDRHSRKPNLKALFEILVRPQQVLELFARNATAGWWCLGDEVVQSQDRRLWRELPC